MNDTERKRNSRRGSSVVEFALVFLPMLMLICGVFEIGRAMWTYHSVSAAVKQATRYTVVRGSGCSSQSSSCAPTVGSVAARIREASLGLEPSNFSLTLTAGPQMINCTTLSSCIGNGTYWPASPNNSVGRTVTIAGEYNFRTFLFGFWPAMNRNGFTFRSASSEVIQF
jgi:Flp pilus assembly protein TadG